MPLRTGAWSRHPHRHNTPLLRWLVQAATGCDVESLKQPTQEASELRVEKLSNTVLVDIMADSSASWVTSKHTRQHYKTNWKTIGWSSCNFAPVYPVYLGTHTMILCSDPPVPHLLLSCSYTMSALQWVALWHNRVRFSSIIERSWVWILAILWPEKVTKTCTLQRFSHHFKHM